MARLARRAAARYEPRDRFARHFAYGKLKGDPVFVHLLREGLIPRGARVLDLGCGQGVLAALLAAAREMHAYGDWPTAWPQPGMPAAIQGIDLSAREVERARRAAGGEARFIHGDIRVAAFEPADVAVMLDVLHYIDPAGQEDVLRRVRAALSGGGTLLLRVADADGSLRFRFTVLADQLATALRRQPLGRLHCRPVAEWRRALESLGFRVEHAPMSEGTPFANVLLAARYDPPQN